MRQDNLRWLYLVGDDREQLVPLSCVDNVEVSKIDENNSLVSIVLKQQDQFFAVKIFADTHECAGDFMYKLQEWLCDTSEFADTVFFIAMES